MLREQGGLRGGKEFFSSGNVSHFCIIFHVTRFSCPLLGIFLAHGFCQWFSISVKELGLLTNLGHWVRDLDSTKSYMYIVL
jgi:hypothetical protein